MVQEGNDADRRGRTVDGSDNDPGHRNFHWDQDKRVFKRKALHDWTSHAADAFAYLALTLKRFPPNLNRGIPMDLGMSESLGIDSLSRGLTMPKSYSADLRERVIEAVEMGASRHEAAERFDVSVSSVVKWHQYWRQTGSAAPKPRGGSVSPLEKSAARVLAVITEHPDLTLMETVAKLGRRRIHTSSALSRFYGRHSITLKKKPASCRTAASGCGTSAQTLDTRARHA